MDKYSVAPVSEEMATEPARKIGEYFADKMMVKTIVSAVFGIAAGLMSFTVDDNMINNVVTIVMFVALLLTPVFAKTEQSALAKGQAEDTRNAVYAPATVQKIVENVSTEAYAAGLPPIEPKPEPDVPSPPADSAG